MTLFNFVAICLFIEWVHLLSIPSVCSIYGFNVMKNTSKGKRDFARFNVPFKIRLDNCLLSPEGSLKILKMEMDKPVSF